MIEHFSTHSVRLFFDTKTKDITRKTKNNKLWTNIHCRYICKNHQKNTSKVNTAIEKGL